MATTSRARPQKPSPRRSIVRRVADAIRRDALERAEGDLLGSEDDLILRYGVSRPTLRQAAALVAQENLVVVKRGVGGGYFVRRPDSQAVAHVAAVFLRSRSTRVDEIIQALAPIRIELAKQASRSTDPELRGRLRRFLEQEEQREQVSFGEFLRSEREFGRLISELSGNQVISLFLEILYDCTAMLSRDEDIFRNHPERVAEYRGKRMRMAAALLDGDEQIAVVAATRCAAATADWMMQDLEHRAPLERLVSIPAFGDEPRSRGSQDEAEPAPRRAAPAASAAPLEQARKRAAVP
jgi:GntR family transcriptional repressor for pyruvate dehydrogenase complex